MRHSGWKDRLRIIGMLAAATLLQTSAMAEDQKWYQGSVCRPLSPGEDIVAINGTLFNKAHSTLYVECPIVRDEIAYAGHTTLDSIQVYVIDNYPGLESKCFFVTALEDGPLWAYIRHWATPSPPWVIHFEHIHVDGAMVLECYIPQAFGNKLSGIRGIRVSEQDDGQP